MKKEEEKESFKVQEHHWNNGEHHIKEIIFDQLIDALEHIETAACYMAKVFNNFENLIHSVIKKHHGDHHHDHHHHGHDDHDYR